MNSIDFQSDYQKLLAKYKDIVVLQSAENVLHWDMETKMPPRAIEQRSLQLALLSRIGHKMSTDPEIGKLLKDTTGNRDYGNLGQIEKRNIYLIKRNYEEQTALPEKLVEETTKQQAISVNTWKKAKNAKNFSILKPELEKLFSLMKQEAEILMKVKETATPYDALIDAYEPKMTSEQINPIFATLQNGLKTIIEKIQNSSEKPHTNITHAAVPVQTQQKIATTLTETLGYDTVSANAGGRIDETEHPFTEGYFDDVRITTHYYADDFVSSIFSVLHETGHALYDQNLNAEWKYQPIGTDCSAGVHESQSRFTENIIGRSKEFWTYALPKLKNIAPELQNLELDPFIHAINTVKLSKIRVEADEVTYNLHIIVRFQMEKDLFAGKIGISELPEVWNQKYEELLGLKVENDSEGVMQDTHWASGYFGYFPSYALGNIYSGQMLREIQQEIPDWRGQLLRGNLDPVKQWLINNVHRQSNLYNPAVLIERITGQKLDAEPYLGYLREKYGLLYGF